MSVQINLFYKGDILAAQGRKDLVAIFSDVKNASILIVACVGLLVFIVAVNIVEWLTSSKKKDDMFPL